VFALQVPQRVAHVPQFVAHVPHWVAQVPQFVWHVLQVAPGQTVKQVRVIGQAQLGNSFVGGHAQVSMVQFCVQPQKV